MAAAATWYDVWKLLHVLAAIVWVGGALMLNILAATVGESGPSVSIALPIRPDSGPMKSRPVRNERPYAIRPRITHRW